MCGRVNVSDNEGVRLLLEVMGMDTWPSRDPRYNIAPTQTLDVVKDDGGLTLEAMSWGVSLNLPGKTGMVTKRIQNARNDKVWSSRLWKPLIENQRVLVPINGFYEWKRAKNESAVAFYITPAERSAMFLAGIYKTFPDELQIPEVSVVTTSANEDMSEIHDRMPVILNSRNAAMAWLCSGSGKNQLNELMKSTNTVNLKFTPVSNFVNNSRNDGPECIEPLAV